MTVRRIAAHLLWTPGGIVRHPVAEVGEHGDVRWIGSSADPDREPFTAFFAGLLVPDFPRDFRAVFARLQMQPDISLAEVLSAVVTPGCGVPVVISGLDYETLRLTPHSRIMKV